jgi:hypothetical protein
VINQANAVSFFEHDEYTKFKNNESAGRKTFQNDAAQAVADKVLNEPSHDLLNSAQAMQRATDEGRLLVYTADSSVENQLQNQPVGGVVPQTSNPFLDVVMNNVAANKIGYYLTRSVTYRRASCAAGTATVTVKIHNSAPKHGLQSYVAGTFHNDPSLAGSTILLLALYDTDGATTEKVTVDGLTRAYRTYSQRGHPVVEPSRFFISPGQTRTVVFTEHEPAATGPLVALSQPGVHPLTQTISAPACTAPSQR